MTSVWCPSRAWLLFSTDTTNMLYCSFHTSSYQCLSRQIHEVTSHMYSKGGTATCGCLCDGTQLSCQTVAGSLYTSQSNLYCLFVPTSVTISNSSVSGQGYKPSWSTGLETSAPRPSFPDFHSLIFKKITFFPSAFTTNTQSNYTVPLIFLPENCTEKSALPYSKEKPGSSPELASMLTSLLFPSTVHHISVRLAVVEDT